MKRALDALWTSLGALLWLASLAAVWLLAAARLSPGPALALTAALLVGIPLALTARFSGALRRVDPSATFAGNLLGFAGITALTLLALALALARPTLSRELLSVGAHSHAPTPLWRAAHTVGLALQPPPPVPVTPAPVTPAPAATLDAGGPTDAPAPSDAAVVAAAPDASTRHALATLEVCSNIRSVWATDLGGDATDELVVDCNDGVRVLWFQLDQGLVSERTSLVLRAPAPWHTVTREARVVDTDGDGRSDVLLCGFWMSDGGGTRGGGVWSAKSLSNGHFARPQRFVPDTACGAIEVGDLNADGRPEVLLADYGNPYLATHPTGALRWFSRGARGFTQRGRIDLLPMPDGLWLGDANGDGITDVMIHHDDDGPAVAPGTRTGISPLDRALTATAAPAHTDVTLDLDRDGAPDQVVASVRSLLIFVTRDVRAPTAITRALDWAEFSVP